MLRTMTQQVLRSNSPRMTVVLQGAKAQTRSASTVAAFRPWKTSKVVSNGDYREETWLEEHIGGPLYENQSKLPRLPVPQISDTLQRFVPTALPLARTEQEASSLLAAVDAFPSQAAQLQERLLQRQAEFHNSSWLQLWWNQAGYLQVRDPVTINVSYFFHLQDDPQATTPEKRAAAFLTATADFRRAVCSGQLPPETVGRKDRQKVLCSTAYKYMFHTTRVPARGQDSYAMYDPSQYNHAIVACKGHFFAMDFCNPTTGEPYSLPVLEAGLKECRAQAEQLAASGAQAPPLLGWLTSQNRDDWADAREALIKASPKFEQALETLQSGALMINLEDEEAPSKLAFGQLLLYAGRGASAGANRWYDKNIQLIVTPDGKAGLMGEHAMMDGMPVVNFTNRLCELTYAKAAGVKSDKSTTSCNVRPIFVEATLDLQGKSKVEVDKLVQKGKDHLVDLVNRHDMHVQCFRGYGSDFIKKAGYSPDAYVQMAMQLATYRLWGEQAGTYEASQVRPFLHGRTETTRTVSTESAGFVKAMGLRPKMDENDAQARKEKLRWLADAVNAHVKYIGLASQAQGVDRHFFGLSMLVQDGEKAPDLYSDPVFQRAKRWRVSTSNLSHPKFENWGYGEVFPDGVGLAYSVHSRFCNFNTVALKEHGWTEKLADLLDEALIEMRTLVEADMAEPKSKL